MIEFKYGAIRRGNQEAGLSTFRGRLTVTLGGNSVDGNTEKQIVELMLKHYETRVIGELTMLKYRGALYVVRYGKLKTFNAEDIWRWSYKEENELPKL